MITQKKDILKFEASKKYILKNAKLAEKEVKGRDIRVMYFGAYTSHIGRVVHNFIDLDGKEPRYRYIIWEGDIAHIEGDNVHSIIGVPYGHRIFNEASNLELEGMKK